MRSDSHGVVGGDNILVVDDSFESLQMLSSTLSPNGYVVKSVLSYSMALTVAQLNPLGLILLDIQMPVMSSYEVFELLEKPKKSCNILIFFVSYFHHVYVKIKAFQLDAIDYTNKLFKVNKTLVIAKHKLTIQRLII